MLVAPEMTPSGVKSRCLGRSRQCCTVACAVHAQDFAFSCMQLRRMRDLCHNRRKYATRRLGTTLETNRFRSFIAYVCARPLRGVVTEWSACIPSDHKVVGSIPTSAASSLLCSLPVLDIKVYLRTPPPNAFLVAELLAFIVTSDGV